MPYAIEVSDEFKDDYKKLCAKNTQFKHSVDNKVNQVCLTLETNPDHYKPLRGGMAGLRRVHIGSFVLIFEPITERHTVILLKLEHHDKAYEH